jgi:hypothetical protein
MVLVVDIHTLTLYIAGLIISEHPELVGTGVRLRYTIL